MGELLREYFSSNSFMPHGHCYLWRPAILWMQVISNGSIGLAYVAIAGGLVFLVRRGRYVPFKGMALAFGIFIVSCGITHFLDVYVIWDPIYWVDSGVRVLTAVASVGTALMLPPLIPKAVALARGARAAHERGIELEAAVNDLGQMYEKAKELDDLKTQFFANVSHELRTPLALILGPIEKLMAADNLTEAQRRDADLVLRNANTLLKHVNDLLDVSRLEADKLEATYSTTDAAELVRVVAAHFDGLADERGIRYQIETPARLEAELDVDKTQRVLLNLLSNAFKFTGADGSVRVALEKSGSDGLRILVADSGPGIRPADRASVFERFRQIDGSSTRRFGGTGLGLTIAKDFVELQCGSISIADAPEGGALFIVEMPRRAPAGAAFRSDTTAPQAFAGSAEQVLDELRTRAGAVESRDGPPERPVILVVEDNADMNRFVADSLADEYRVERAYDGEEGLKKAIELAPDLIVSDVMMPRMSGDQLVAAIRERPALDKVPILILTAKADDVLRVRLLQEGAQDYLTKPFADRELKARAGNLVTMKRVRDVLEREIESQIGDLEKLALEVTDRKRELHSALDAMRVAREHAERASQVKTGFLGLVSHELRSPLAALKLQLEQIRAAESEGLSDSARALLGRMQSSADRLGDLIEGLLEHARLQSQRGAVDVEPVDLAAVARDVAAEARPEADRKSLEIELDLAPDVPPLTSDRRMLRLILQSLVGNAVKFTDEGSVRIAVSSIDGRHRIDVVDTGPGISGEDQIRIFEPFEQLEHVRRKHVPGLGLGLALVRDLVGSLGGRMEVESIVGHGSRFTVIF